MKPEEFNLLLSVARILRSHIASPTNGDAYQADDLAMLDEALAPWAPDDVDPVNQSNNINDSYARGGYVER